MSRDVGFLMNHAIGLDLRDPEDRTTFRYRLGHAFRNTKVSYMREWLGNTPERTRDAVVKALANAYIAQVFP